jgi:hypothetical protein
MGCQMARSKEEERQQQVVHTAPKFRWRAQSGVQTDQWSTPRSLLQSNGEKVLDLRKARILSK